MLRRFFLGVSLPVFGNPMDYTHEKQESNTANETGWDRLIRVVQPDEFGGLSEEVETVLQVSCMSMFVGAMYGGVIQSRVAYMEFFKNNQATVFRDHLEAKKRLQDKVTLGFGRGAFRWGWRLTLFTTTYVSISTAISTYRNKHGILEYIIAGTVTGATYKFNMGPRGWLVGGGLGCLLGVVAGGTTMGILKLAGITIEDTRKYNSKWRRMREEETAKGIKQHLEKDDLQLLLEHNKKIEAAVKEQMASLDANKEQMASQNVNS